MPIAIKAKTRLFCWQIRCELGGLTHHHHAFTMLSLSYDYKQKVWKIYLLNVSHSDADRSDFIVIFIAWLSYCQQKLFCGNIFFLFNQSKWVRLSWVFIWLKTYISQSSQMEAPRMWMRIITMMIIITFQQTALV